MNLNLAVIAADTEASLGLDRHRTYSWHSRKLAAKLVRTASDTYHRAPSAETAELVMLCALDLADKHPLSNAVHDVVRGAAKAVVDSGHYAAERMRWALEYSETLLDIKQVIPTFRTAAVTDKGMSRSLLNSWNRAGGGE